MKRYLYTWETWQLNVLVSTLRQTTYETPVEYGGHTWTPTIIRHAGMSLNMQKTAATLDITVLRDHPIAARFVGAYPTATLRVQVHELDDDGTLTLEYAGIVRERAGTSNPLEAKLTCTNKLGQLQRPVPRLKYTPPCAWPLYSADCGANKAANARAGTVLSVSADGKTLTTTLAEADGFFAAGLVEANGQSRMAVGNKPDGTLELFGAMNLQAGDAITAYRGCNRTFEHCRDRFANTLNYGGMHYQVDKNIFFNPIGG